MLTRFEVLVLAAAVTSVSSANMERSANSAGCGLDRLDICSSKLAPTLTVVNELVSAASSAAVSASSSVVSAPAAAAVVKRRESPLVSSVAYMAVLCEAGNWQLSERRVDRRVHADVLLLLLLLLLLLASTVGLTAARWPLKWPATSSVCDRSPLVSSLPLVAAVAKDVEGDNTLLMLVGGDLCKPSVLPAAAASNDSRRARR